MSDGPRRALAVIAVALALGCQKAPAPTPLERGERTFARNCAACHGSDGRGLPSSPFNPPPRDLAAPEFHAGVSDADLAAILRQGKGAMPALGRMMSDEELSSLIAFLRALPLRPRRTP